MIRRDDRFPVVTIWLLILLGGVQLGIWFILADGLPRSRADILPEAICWLTLLLLAALVTRRGSRLQRCLAEHEITGEANTEQLERLRLDNEMLTIVGRTLEVPDAFQSLAPGIEHLVPCDRVGLALLSDDRLELRTFTARPPEGDSRAKPRSEMVFRVEGTALGQVIRSREPLILDDTREASSSYLDAIVLAGAGFQSALLVPLAADGRVVGTVNLVSRRAGAFTVAHAESVAWIAQILAVAWMAQQRQRATGRRQTEQAMRELTVSVSAEINGALQAIIGHCELIQREYTDDRLRADVDTIVRRAERISALIERIRPAAEGPSSERV